MQFEGINNVNRGLDIQIASQIARKILSEELKAHDILPSEFELCEQFKVSRTAVREALKILSSKGLIESKPKIGARVKSREYWNLFDIQLINWIGEMDELTEAMYIQFLDFRRVIEPDATRLAAIHATKEQRIELSRIYSRMCIIAKNKDIDHWVEIDTEFHRAIFESSGNCFYIPLGNVMSAIFRWFISYSSKDGGMCLTDHQAIYEAIMSGDADAAYNASKNLMREDKHRL